MHVHQKVWPQIALEIFKIKFKTNVAAGTPNIVRITSRYPVFQKIRSKHITQCEEWCWGPNQTLTHVVTFEI